MIERNEIDIVWIQKRKQIKDKFVKAGASPDIVFKVLNPPKMIEL